MLDRNTPAKFISFLYETFTVRFHIYSEDGSIWVVGKDLCNILHKTNPSYLTKYLPKEAVIKHKINTLKGSQSILWFKIDNLRYIKHNIYATCEEIHTVKKCLQVLKLVHELKLEHKM